MRVGSHFVLLSDGKIALVLNDVEETCAPSFLVNFGQFISEL